MFKKIKKFSNYSICSKTGQIRNDKSRRILKPTNEKYPRIHLIDDNGNKKCCFIHRLIALTYIPNPDNKPFVNHIDHNTYNFSIANLEWVTNSENIKKSIEIGGKIYGKKGIEVLQYDINGKYMTTYPTISSVYENTGISDRLVRRSLKDNKGIIIKGSKVKERNGKYVCFKYNEYQRSRDGEEWRDLIYNNIATNYEVSNLGRIKNKKNNYIKTNKINGCYESINLHFGGRIKTMRVHRLVALVFIPNPDNKNYVDHIDEDKLNNNKNNLRWVTIKENTNYSIKNRKKRGDNFSHQHRRIIQITWDSNPKIVAEYNSIKEAEEQFSNCKSKQIASVCSYYNDILNQRTIKYERKTSRGFAWIHKENKRYIEQVFKYIIKCKKKEEDSLE